MGTIIGTANRVRKRRGREKAFAYARLRRRRTAAGAILAVLAIPSCGQATAPDTDNRSGTSTMSSTPATSTTPQPPEPTPNVDEELVTQLWAGVVFTWYALPTPAHLADIPDIELVVTGRIQGFEPGPIYFAETLDDPEAEPNVVMSVTVDEVIKGDIQPGSTVYVAREHEKPLAAYSEALPPGTVVGLYLDRAPQEGDREGFVVGNETAGRPPGEPLWQVGPQAFIVADGDDGGVVFPVDPRVSPEADFEDQLPPPDPTPSTD